MNISIKDFLSVTAVAACIKCSNCHCVTNRVKTLAAHRRARLNEAQTLHQFFRDIDDEEAWIKYVITFSTLFCLF